MASALSSSATPQEVVVYRSNREVGGVLAVLEGHPRETFVAVTDGDFERRAILAACRKAPDERDGGIEFLRVTNKPRSFELQIDMA